MAVSRTYSNRASTSKAVPRFPSNFSVVAQASQQYETVPAVFLSHSGRQKGFVERIYDALVNAGHSPFFDRETIPRAVQLSDYIKRCASECRLGIVVLSNEFVTTKWPMLELDIMTNSHVDIFPLFYELSVDDLKDATKLSEWRQKWEIIAAKDTSIDVNKWERALKSLPTWSGLVFHAKTSETLYINNIVSEVSKKIVPVVTYDLSYVKGDRRLIQEIVERFDRVQPICSSSSRPCALGLYAVGGFGKTTLCKLMVNFYKSEYAGKCELMEFPSTRNKESIVEECKKILKRFFSVNESLLAQVDEFDKALQLLRDRNNTHKVFLAMDNIWDHSLEEARRILGIEFAPGSKVLVTGRSEAVLKKLLTVHDKDCVGCLPSMNEKEALETLDASSGKELSSLVSQDVLDRVVRQCCFKGSYHPLVLNAMGQRLSRIEGWGDVEAVQNRLCRGRSSELSEIEDVIKSNFLEVPSIRQRMFLDVVAIVNKWSSLEGWWPRRYPSHPSIDEIRDWLRILYEECSSHDAIDDALEQLAFDGLVRFEGNYIEVHDLYVELAEREVASSDWFLMVRDGNVRETGNMKMVEWAKLKRIIVRGDSCSLAVEPAHRSNVEVVIMERATAFAKGLRWESMTSLRVCKIEGVAMNLTGLRAAERLMVLHLIECEKEVETATLLRTMRVNRCQRKGLLDLGGCRLLRELMLRRSSWLVDGNCLPALTSLTRLELDGGADTSTKLPDLSGLGQLTELRICSYKFLKEIGVLPSSLKAFEVGSCKSLKKIGFLPFDLRSLYLQNCQSLKEIGVFPSIANGSNSRVLDIRTCPQLQIVYIYRCESLGDVWVLPSKIQELAVWTCLSLKKLVFDVLSFETSDTRLETSRYYSFPNLRDFCVQGCPYLRKLPVATKLEELRIRGCESLGEIQSLPFSLKTLEIVSCTSLQTISGLRGLSVDIDGSLQRISEFYPNLESLSLERNAWNANGKFPSRPHTIAAFPSNVKYLSLRYFESRLEIWEFPFELQELTIESCGWLQRIPEFPSNLKRLTIRWNGSLQRIPELPSNLKLLTIKCNWSLQEIPKLPLNLETLNISGKWGSLQELTELRLSHLGIEDCGALKEIPNFPLNLEKFKIGRCESLQELPQFPSNLKSLSIEDCGSLQEIPRFPCNLEALSIHGCGSLRGIQEFPFPCKLSWISLLDCPNIEELPSMSALVYLRYLSIRHCWALKEMRYLPSSLPRSSFIAEPREFLLQRQQRRKRDSQLRFIFQWTLIGLLVCFYIDYFREYRILLSLVMSAVVIAGYIFLGPYTEEFK